MEQPTYCYQKPRLKRCNDSLQSCLPISLESFTKSYLWDFNIYHGKLVDGFVHIYDINEMKKLYDMGFFGKGSFSRGRPGLLTKIDNQMEKNKNKLLSNIMSKRRYCVLKQMKKENISTISKEALIEYSIMDPPKIRRKNLWQLTEPNSSLNTNIYTKNYSSDSLIPKLNINIIENTFCETSDAIENNQEEHDTLNLLNNINSPNNNDPWSKENYEESKSFWESEDFNTNIPDYKNKLKSNNDVSNEYNLITSNNNNESSSLNTDQYSGVNYEKSSDFNETSINDEKSYKNKLYLKENDLKSSIDNILCPVQDSMKINNNENKNFDSNLNVKDQKKISEINTESFFTKHVLNNSINQFTDTPLMNREINNKLIDNLSDGIEPLIEDNISDGEDDEIIDDDTAILVVDFDNEGKRPLVKKHPNLMLEYLILSHEEAFFLSYALGCLVVRNDEGKNLNLKEMWQAFIKLNSHFVYKYAVYHYFRSKGWVPRSGIKFGVDFVLYKKGPSFYHSSYSVIVIPLNVNNLEVSSCIESFPSDFISLACLNRVNEQVAKELLFCFVLLPKEKTFDFTQSPKGISSLKIMEVIAKRWISKKEREQSEFLVIP